MTIVCPHCGAENRATAKFCNSCAKLMVNLDTGEVLPRKKRRRRRKSSQTKQSLGLLRPATLAVLAAILLLGGAWWYFTQEAAQKTVGQQEIKGSFTPHAGASQPTRTAATEPAPVYFPSYVPIEPASSAASTAKQPATHEASPKADKPAAARPAKPQPKTAPRARVATPEPETQVAETPPRIPAAPAAPPRPTPEQACAGTAFLSRAACMQSQCANSSHPQCRRMRETQEALRRGSGGG